MDLIQQHDIWLKEEKVRLERWKAVGRFYCVGKGEL